MRDAVEVAFEVSVHHMGVTVLKVSINLPQRVFAAFAWSKSVTHGQEFFLKDRLYHPLDRRLHDSVFDCRDTQGSRFTACFGYFYPPHRLGPVFSLFEVFAQFAQVHQFISRKAFYALPVYACGTLVRFDLLPSRVQGAWAIDFIDQTKPCVSFDAVAQRRQHTLCPDSTIHPRPFGRGSFSLFSLFWHWH